MKIKFSLEAHAADVKKVLPQLNILKWADSEFRHANAKVFVECFEHGEGWLWGTPWLPKLSHLKSGHGCPKCSNTYSPTEIEVINNFNNTPLSKLIISSIPEYKGAKSVCHVICSLHGEGWQWRNPWLPKLTKLKGRAECPKCTKKYKPTESEALEIVASALPQHLTLKKFIEYKGLDKSRCYIHCQKHGSGWKWGNQWIPTAGNLKDNKRGCPKCSNLYRSTKIEIIDSFQHPFLKIVDIPAYKNNKSVCHVNCKHHGNTWQWGNPWIPPVTKLLMGDGCPKCGNVYRKTENELVEGIKRSIKGKPFSLIGIPNHNGNDSRCHVTCPKHGNGWEWANPWLPTANNLNKINRCPKCAGQYSKTKDETISSINPVIMPFLEIKDIPNFSGSDSRCHVQCNIHGNGWEWSKPWNPMVYNLETGYGCPRCDAASNSLKQVLKNPIQQKRPKYLYYIEFKDILDDSVFWKIGFCDMGGIQKRYPKGRLKSDNISILNEYIMKDNAFNVLLAEYYVLTSFSKFLIDKRDTLRAVGGGTECFSVDILKNTKLDLIRNKSILMKQILINRALEL